MISEKPWSLQAVARLFLGVIFTFCVGGALAGLLDAKSLKIAPAQIEFIQMLIMLLAFQVAALGWVAFFLRQSHLSWGEAFGLTSPAWARMICAGMIIGILVVPALWALQSVSQAVLERIHVKPEEQAAVKELEDSKLPASELIVFGGFTILLAPMAEETLFRGILYPTVKQMGFPRWALWGTSVLFGVMHFNLASLLPLILLAVLLTLLYESSGSLLTPIATHATFNAANFFYLIFSDKIDTLAHHLHLT